MPGGLIQLTVTGKQNKILTGKPEMTYFKYAYKQHTNFACESIQQTFNGVSDFGKKISTTISRNGDLVTNMTVQIDLPDVNKNRNSVEESDGSKTILNWVNAVGHRIIDYVEIEIGGTRIDRHTGDWLELNSELCLDESKKRAYWKMIGKDDFYYITNDDQSKTLYIPFQFWFCKESGLALPIVALQHHDVKVNIKFRELRDLITAQKINVDNTVEEITDLAAIIPLDVSITRATLLCDYVYLDVCERKWFAQHSHKYLIEQVQYNGDTGIVSSSEHKMFLDFSHPCKELVWFTRRSVTTHANDWLNFGQTDNTDKYLWGSRSNDDICKRMTLFLNGHERTEEREGEYFRLVNAYNNHTRIPNNYIYTYSFALHPEKQEPSGALNFSLIDEAFVQLKMDNNNVPFTLHVYAKNYNMLAITQGMGGLVFSS